MKHCDIRVSCWCSPKIGLHVKRDRGVIVKAFFFFFNLHKFQARYTLGVNRNGLSQGAESVFV